MRPPVELSVVVPVSDRHEDLPTLHARYRDAVEATGRQWECIYVLDGPAPDTLAALQGIQAEDERVVVVQLARTFGEATALTAGFDHSSGDLILTLPAYLQVAPDRLPLLFDTIEQADMVLGVRSPRGDPWINRLQSRVFHGILRFLTGRTYADLGCGVRLFRRDVAEEVPLYGDQHRFHPMLAERAGFKLREVPLPQAEEDKFRRIYRLGAYPRRILDMLTVFFLVKFTKKPLRFFGLVGATSAGVGAVWMLWLVLQRLAFGVALADRPALLLSTLLVVLGAQVFALGLLGELIIFTHARGMKEYTVERVITGGPNDPGASVDRGARAERA